MNDHRADVEMTCNDSSADEAPLIGRAGARHALLAPRVVLSREGECVQFNGSARVRLSAPRLVRVKPVVSSYHTISKLSAQSTTCVEETHNVRDVSLCTYVSSCDVSSSGPSNALL